MDATTRRSTRWRSPAPSAPASRAPRRAQLGFERRDVGIGPDLDVPLSAFDPQPPGAPPITINGLQLANTQLANTQLANTQLAHTQLANTQLAHTQLANTQLANTQLANTQLAQTQLANTQLANTQLANTQLAHTQLANTQLAHTQLANTGLSLDTVPLNTTLYPDGWAGLLQGTTLDGQPLQTITLDEVLGAHDRQRLLTRRGMSRSG